jgi:hypothetical protein
MRRSYLRPFPCFRKSWNELPEEFPVSSSFLLNVGLPPRVSSRNSTASCVRQLHTGTSRSFRGIMHSALSVVPFHVNLWRKQPAAGISGRFANFSQADSEQFV